MYLVIDIGGTKTLIAAFTKRGRVIRKLRFKTPDNRKEFEAMLKSALIPFSVKHRRKISQIVIAIPGWIENNVAIKFGNRPWKNFDIAGCIKNLFNCPITLENDASLATVYESYFHRGLSLYLTFSTGIGGGLARSGKLAKNSNSVEPGHTLYLFGENHLEWEDIASCAAIGKAYGCQATSVRGEKAYLDIAHRVSLGLPELIHRYHPNCIVIGGPLALLFPHFITPLKSNLRQILGPNAKIPRIVPAKRPKESVIYGGYLYGKSLQASSRKSRHHSKQPQ